MCMKLWLAMHAGVADSHRVKLSNLNRGLKIGILVQSDTK